MIGKSRNLNERLLEAARYNDFEGIKKMIDAGADINYRDEEEDDAVVIAVVNHQVDILKYLIKKGAKITSLYDRKKRIFFILLSKMTWRIRFFSRLLIFW